MFKYWMSTFSGLQLVCVVLPGKTPVYVELKRVGDTVLGGHRHSVLAGNNVIKTTRQTPSKLCLKIKLKLAGVNSILLPGNSMDICEMEAKYGQIQVDPGSHQHQVRHCPAQHKILCQDTMVEVLTNIFSHSYAVELCNISCVSKYWYGVAQGSRLWKALCHGEGMLHDLKNDQQAQSMDICEMEAKYGQIQVDPGSHQHQVRHCPAQHKILCQDTMVEVLTNIFSHSYAVELCNISCVSKYWYGVAQGSRLWKALCHGEGMLHDLKNDQQAQSLDYKAHYKQCTVVRRKWLTGQGVYKHCKQLRGPDGNKFRGYPYAMSSQHIFTQRIVDCDSDFNIYVFSTATGDYSHQLQGMTRRIFHLLLSKNDTVAVASVHSEPIIRVWNAGSGELMHTIECDPTEFPDLALMALHDKVLAVYGETTSLFVYNIESGQMLHELTGHQANAYKVEVGMKHIISCDCVGTVKLWDIPTGCCRFTWNLPHSGLLQIDNESQSATHWCNGHGLTVFDTETGAVKSNVPMPQGYATSLINSGTMFIQFELQLIVVDLGSGQLIGTVRGPPGLLSNTPNLLNNGLLVTTGYGDGCCAIELWDTKNMTYVRRIIDSRLFVTRMWAGSNQLHYLGSGGSFSKQKGSLCLVRFKFDMHA